MSNGLAKITTYPIFYFMGFVDLFTSNLWQTTLILHPNMFATNYQKHQHLNGELYKFFYILLIKQGVNSKVWLKFSSKMLTSSFILNSSIMSSCRNRFLDIPWCFQIAMPLIVIYIFRIETVYLLVKRSIAKWYVRTTTWKVLRGGCI